jgi:hypothetical protein
MRLLLTLGALLLASGCSLGYPPNDPKGKAGTPPPTPTELRALLDKPTGKPHTEAPFELRFSPSIALPGHSVWMTCHVPPSFKAQRIGTQLEGKGRRERAYEFYSPELLDNLPCGTWAGTCVVLLANGDVRITQRELEVKGGLCDGQ